MRRFVIAFLLALAYMTSPWLVAAEQISYVERMYDAMEWCMPSDRVAEPPTIRPNGTESMFVAAGLYEFVLMVVPPTTYLEVINVKHPDNQLVRIGFEVPPQTDIPSVLEQKKVFMQLATGCFALTHPPR